MAAFDRLFGVIVLLGSASSASCACLQLAAETAIVF